MNVESIQVPSERVPPVATDMASSSKVMAGVLGFVTIIVLFAIMGMVSDKPSELSGSGDSAHAAGQRVGQAIAFLLMAGAPALFAFRAARNASRATRAANVAKTDPKYTFRLSGKYIIASDGAGVPHPELSFKVNGKNRTMLLALPRAEIIDR